METRAVRETRDSVEGWRIDGGKKWQTGMHKATHCFIFARTSGQDGDLRGITCFIVPRETPGLNVESYEWYVEPLTGLPSRELSASGCAQGVFQTTDFSRGVSSKQNF